MYYPRPIHLAVLMVVFGVFVRVGSAQLLETETARLPKKRVLELASNFEFQTSSEGREYAVPLAVEYGVTDRLEFLVEPVAYTAIRPATGPRAAGIGDLEVTLTYLLRPESPTAPAFAVAGEVKLPLARNTLIGTGKTDLAGYLIESKRFNRLDTHANIGYTIVGQPAGAHLKNIFNGAVAALLPMGPKTEIFGEVLANSASVAEEDAASPTSESTITPEAPTGEVVATLGMARYLTPSFKLALGISYDNNQDIQWRPGIIWKF